MHKSKYIAMVAATAMALTLAGCGSKGGELIEVTPTPMATPTPTVVPATVTPLPTSTLFTVVLLKLPADNVLN